MKSEFLVPFGGKGGSHKPDTALYCQSCCRRTEEIGARHVVCERLPRADRCLLGGDLHLDPVGDELFHLEPVLPDYLLGNQQLQRVRSRAGVGGNDMGELCQPMLVHFQLDRATVTPFRVFVAQ